MFRRRPLPRHRRPPDRRRPPRWAGLTLAACGVAATAAGVAGWFLLGQAAPPKAGRPPVVPVPAGSPVALRRPGTHQVARPARLVIPSIGVSTRLIRLGMTSSHTLQVPVTTSVAGWYTGSPRPGALGSSIIAGHIDSRIGPGVFFRLHDLRRGERAYVVRANHTVAVFRVVAVRTYAKDHFPTASVYGPVPDAELRLITCGGVFDDATGSYLSNVVVYAVLAGQLDQERMPASRPARRES